MLDKYLAHGFRTSPPKTCRLIWLCKTTARTACSASGSTAIKSQRMVERPYAQTFMRHQFCLPSGLERRSTVSISCFVRRLDRNVVALYPSLALPAARAGTPQNGICLFPCLPARRSWVHKALWNQPHAAAEPPLSCRRCPVWPFNEGQEIQRRVCVKRDPPVRPDCCPVRKMSRGPAAIKPRGPRVFNWTGFHSFKTGQLLQPAGWL